MVLARAPGCLLHSSGDGECTQQARKHHDSDYILRIMLDLWQHLDSGSICEALLLVPIGGLAGALSRALHKVSSPGCRVP
jgi:hypothetical protein